MLKKSVSIIDPIGTKGGHHYYSLSLLNALESKGVKTLYFSNLESSDYSETQCIQLVEGSINKSFRGFYKLIVGTFKSIKIARRNNVKTQIYHVFEASFNNCGILLLFKLFGFKTIVVVHDVKSFDFKENVLFRVLQYKALSDEIIVHNEYSRSTLQSLITNNRTPVHTLRHGGHFQVINRVKKDEARLLLNFSPDKKYFLFFGQIRESKGLDILLKAFPKEDNYVLIIAGKLWRTTFSDYQKIINNRGLGNYIHLDLGYVEDYKRDLYYSAADCVILPYREIYQSGVLLMAMSYGKMVIASDLPANREVIKSGVNGLLFENENVNSLRNKLSSMSEYDAEEIGENAIETINTSYNWYDIAENYLPLIK